MRAALCFLAACGATATPDAPTTADAVAAEPKNFLLGFAHAPYDDTDAAADWTWNKVSSYGDVISLTFEEGIPWDEALANTEYPAAFRDAVRSAAARVPTLTSSMLQVTPLSRMRDALALRRGTEPNMPLTGDWTTATLRDADVKTAYANYVATLIGWVRPKWAIIVLEGNEYMAATPAAWADLVELTCATTTALRARGITTPLLASVRALELMPEGGNPALADQLRAASELAACVDGLALSLHPHDSTLEANPVPSDLFDRLNAAVPNVWGVSEASYPAQTFSLGDTSWYGTEAKHAAFVSQLLQAGDAQPWRFIVWTSIRDTDALWDMMPPSPETDRALLTRDAGMHDEAGSARSGLTTWDQALRRPTR